MVKFKSKNYGAIALKLHNDFLQGLNEQGKQDLYLCRKYYDESINESKEQEQQDHKWKCDLCEKQYECKDELKTHEKEHHEWRCGQCEKRYVHIKELSKHLKKEHGIRRYDCPMCGKEFDNLEELKVHEKNSYVCDLCDHCCTESRKELENHVRWRHYKNCYICEQCSNWYNNREDLEDHIEKRHMTNNICSKCKDEFESIEKLRVHERNCYICEQCNSWYESSEELEDHKNKAHSKEWGVNFECRKEREKQNDENQIYESKCDLCNEEFKDKNELVEHWEKDHEVQIYKCIHLECRSKYINQEIWKEHMKDKHGI